MLFSVGAKEIDEDAVDEDRVVYQGIDSVLGIRIHRDSSQILNVLQQQATYELENGSGEAASDGMRLQQRSSSGSVPDDSIVGGTEHKQQRKWQGDKKE